VAIISETRDYNGFAQKVERLGLGPLVAEASSTLSFPLLVEERKHANGTRGLRRMIDDAFYQLGGWKIVKSGSIDWTKSGERGSTLGVEVQVSGRSDMLAVDIMHLKEKISAGEIDAGIIIVPDDTLSPFLTDRTPNLATAIKHIEDRAKDLPIRVLAFRHDGPGPALGKMRTNLGREPAWYEKPTSQRKVAERPEDHDSEKP
jgi:hypothetical protein